MMSFATPAAWLTGRVQVSVIGAGGTGSELMAQLYKMHHCLRKLGHDGLDLTLIDGDKVSETNVGRQSFWENDIGMYKAEVLVKRFNTYGGTNWHYANEYVDPGYMLENNHFHNCDLLITCVDKASFRAILGDEGSNYETDMLWLDAGNGESSGQVILGHLGTPTMGIRLPNVFDLFPSLVSIEDIETDSCSHEDALMRQTFGINVDMASAARNLIWQMLRHGKIEHHGVFIDLNAAQADALRIDPHVWLSFGYREEKKAA